MSDGISADEARRLREAATPGPWDVAEHDEEEFWFGAGYFAIEVGDPDEYGDHGSVAITGNHGNAVADMALIAAAPALAATVERLEADNQRLTSALGEVVDWLGTPDWSGPQLPRDLARRIAAALSDEGDTDE